MLNRITGFTVNFAGRWVPDPFVIAIFLTIICFLSVISFTDFSAINTISAWGDSFWNLLSFTGQMILILGLGHMAAHTRPAFKFLIWLAGFIKSARVAYFTLTLISGGFAIISWGLGLVVPAVLSRIIAGNCKERGIQVHFPLLVTCGYVGSVVGMQGLSSSIALTVNTPGHFLEETIGLIPLSQTIFSPWSMVIVLAILVTLPSVMTLLAPDQNDILEMPDNAAPKSSENFNVQSDVQTPAQKLETSRLVSFILAVFGTIYIVYYFLSGGGLNLNSMNMSFIVLCLWFCDNPRHFLQLLSNSAKIISPLLIQYPLYAGLMGMIAASGLGDLIVTGFINISTKETLPIWIFFSAGFLNLFIPSAGGQWAVQGPIAVAAAMELGTDVSRIAMAVAIGEVWTNTIQPLYAIPVLTIAGLHLRDIMGYSIFALFTLGPIYLTALIFF